LRSQTFISCRAVVLFLAELIVRQARFDVSLTDLLAAGCTVDHAAAASDGNTNQNVKTKTKTKTKMLRLKTKTKAARPRPRPKA